MIDLETTGTDPVNNAIIQLCAVRFNYDTGAVDPNMFVGYMTVPYGRFWDEDTREWWMTQNLELLQSILAQGRDPAGIFHAFSNWAWLPGAAGQRLWAKPITFEWPFLQSYAKQFGVTLPFHYRDAVDLNSFCRGLGNDPGLSPIEKEIEFEGEMHNAVDDVMHQIKTALMARHMIQRAA